MSIAVVRVRGTLNIKPEIRETLKFLRLNRVNHCVVIPDNPVYRGMLQKAKDYVTWGEIEPDVMSKLLSERGRLDGDEELTDAYIKRNSDFKNAKEMAEAIAKDDYELKQLPGITPVFRLAPPVKGGYEGIKRAYSVGGALGYRGSEINKLLQRML
ncbi:MAG: 50S ribosomal protein L30 [Thermoplasmatota archaeon]